MSSEKTTDYNEAKQKEFDIMLKKSRELLQENEILKARNQALLGYKQLTDAFLSKIIPSNSSYNIYDEARILIEKGREV